MFHSNCELAALTVSRLVLSPYEIQEPFWLARTHSRLQSNAFVHRWEDRRHDQWGYIKRRASSLLRATETSFINATTRLVLLYPFKDSESVRNKVETVLDNFVKSLRDMSPQRKWEMFFFRTVESFNTVWLIYIVVAQTWGFYKTCDCVTSNWGGAGGYLDFSVQDIASQWVETYWLTGTLVTSTVMGISMFYITVEWCQQSFLTTEDYEDARKGLRMTRIYRRLTFSFRRISRLLSRFTFDPMERLGVAIGLIKYPQKTLLWTKEHTHDPDIPIAMLQIVRPHGIPAVEPSDFSTAMVRDDSQQSHHAHETPAQAHSLFPPVIPQRRARHDSESSAVRTLPSFRGHGSSSSPLSLTNRPSYDSSVVPLLQHPPQVHHQREYAGSATLMPDDHSCGSGENHELASPESPMPVRVEDSSFLHARMGDVSQSQQAFARANSNSGRSSNSGAEGLALIGIDFE